MSSQIKCGGQCPLYRAKGDIMASTGDGFRATIGVILAIVFACIVVPTLAMMLFCGGCVAMFGVTADAVNKEREAAERRLREEAKAEAAKPKAELPEKIINPVDAPQQKPELPMPEPIKPDDAGSPEPAKPDEKPEPDARPEASSKPTPAQEKAAASKLSLAKSMLSKSPVAAQRRLKEIIEKHPGTKAAEEAAKLLTP